MEMTFFDGAMGTILQKQGLEGLPEIWNITHPHEIERIHKSYVDCGCNIIKTNTFGANRLKLAKTDFGVAQVISAGVQIARKAAGERARVALDIGPSGKLLAPFGDLDFEAAIEIFAEMIRAGAAAGADLVLIETMSDTYEIKAAMIAAKESCDLPIMVTFTPDAAGRLLTGADILTAVNVVQSLGAAAIGLNCGAGPAQMRGLIGQVLENTDIPVICSPNGGLPRVVGGETVFDIDAAEFARQMAEIAALGVTHLGGCCGTTPAHIAAMIAACAEITPPARIVKKTTRISSYGKTVEFGKKMIIIGERINPTGKARLKQALRENNMEYVLREGLAQIAEGADILDVNAGMPGIDEAASLARAVAALQSIVPTPLCIDTANIAAAEAALRVYNGKPLLNSVSGKSESMAAILPLAKKYGAAVVALALDDDGIPETAEGRAAIVDKIIKCAAEYGISKSNIVMDALTLTISTGADNARVTLEGLDRARDLGVCTILGVSNISFGLPARHTLNAGFLTLAANRGLSAAIINTAHKPMMDAVFIHNLLAGLDENAAEYIGRFSEQTEMAAEKADMTLFDAILHGLCDVARDSVKILLNNEDSLNIINQHLIPALDKAGQDFAAQKIFLPQLLMSAAAAKAAFEAISAHMLAKGQQTKKRGKIILATVKGDIHDIGKNIVKVLLENYNFEVIDLGKNVAPEAVLDAAIAQGADLVGLSALMTTTVVYMEQTIALLRQKAPGIPIMVGGAVLTQSYADQIGADFYSPDAMGAVRYASEIIGE